MRLAACMHAPADCAPAVGRTRATRSSHQDTRHGGTHSTPLIAGIGTRHGRRTARTRPARAGRMNAHGGLRRGGRACVDYLARPGERQPAPPPVLLRACACRCQSPTSQRATSSTFRPPICGRRARHRDSRRRARRRGPSWRRRCRRRRRRRRPRRTLKNLA